MGDGQFETRPRSLPERNILDILDILYILDILFFYFFLRHIAVRILEYAFDRSEQVKRAVLVVIPSESAQYFSYKIVRRSFSSSVL